ncbi:uncharacterized protein PG998_005665 [Apiospora kogelbergensis]|uniref:uncharacterized protein n=1 Tax=Apiospora kogelbergensis TaxID=1337665 RepID=UPI0031327E90
MSSRKTNSRSETHSIKGSPTTSTVPGSAITPLTASTAVPCPHSDGALPVCWDCIEAGHPGNRTKAGVASPTVGGHDLTSPLSEKKRKRSKASILSKLSSRASHSTLQVHPPEPGKEVIMADYHHLSQAGMEVLAGPRAVDPTSPSYYKNNNNHSIANKTKRTDVENRDVGSSTDRGHAFSPRPGEGRILGMRKKRFWLSALLIGLLVVVITVGVVVAMLQTGKFAKNTSAQASSRIGCGFSRDGGDLQSITAATFLQCMQECAKRTGCVGVSWINDGDAGSANNYCYTKLSMDGKARNNVFAQTAELTTG